MGLTPGTEVTVRKVAPFGDPVELNLRGYELSLRKADAAQIRVATGAEGERRAQTRRRRIGMVQHIPDEETLRRMPTTPMRRRSTAACPTTPATTHGR